MSRKELIQQEYNLLLETRLPNIMQLMNSEKSLGLGLGYRANPTDINESSCGGEIKQEDILSAIQRGTHGGSRLNSHAGRHVGKQSLDYDDLKQRNVNLEAHPFIEKMFSNGDTDIKNLSKNSTHQTSLNALHSNGGGKNMKKDDSL